ncbi:hypothetical protein DL98DRAFT_662444 [Cadophora sp. DSE1049]|nr:hypothetical protein DL98DRAFT_662444 [Cadophora sp. DSE1049]
MSDCVDNQNWANQMMDGDEEPALSGSLMNPNTGSGRTTRAWKASNRFWPVLLGQHNDQSWHPNGGLIPDDLSAAPERVFEQLSADTGNDSVFNNQVQEPWNLGGDIGLGSSLGMGGMDVELGMGMDMDIGFDTFPASPFSPTHDLSGQGQYINYGHQGFQALDMSSMSRNDLGSHYQASPTLPGYLLNPIYPTMPMVVPAAIIAAPTSTTQGQFVCTFPNCITTFTRNTDRIRHESSVHGLNRPLYLCPIQRCNKSIGPGYTRKDKLTEHLWKKHPNLGFFRRV